MSPVKLNALHIVVVALFLRQVMLAGWLAAVRWDDSEANESARYSFLLANWWRWRSESLCSTEWTHSRAADVADRSKHRHVSGFWKTPQNKANTVGKQTILLECVTEITKIPEQSLTGSLLFVTFSPYQVLSFQNSSFHSHHYSQFL